MPEHVRKFRITKRAKEDLVDIGRYTERIWSKKQRDKYLGELDACFYRLGKNAKLGRHRPEIHDDYYSFPQGSHVVFYMIGRDFIDIIGIPHKRMDIGSYF